MKLRIEIDLDNDAFVGSRLVPEIKRILDTTFRCLRPLRRHQLTSFAQKLVDVNGNGVGRATIAEPEREPATKWEDNHLQFPRFAVEAVGVLTEDQHRLMAESMDLRVAEIGNLLDRIEIEWTRIKAGESLRRVTPGGELLGYAASALSGERKRDSG